MTAIFLHELSLLLQDSSTTLYLVCKINIVENAIKYGYQSNTNSIDIQVQISQEANGELLLQVFDEGQPFPNNLPSGYGLQSVRKKLDLLLPEMYELAFINAPKKHVSITLY